MNKDTPSREGKLCAPIEDNFFHCLRDSDVGLYDQAEQPCIAPRTALPSMHLNALVCIIRNPQYINIDFLMIYDRTHA